MSKLVKTNKKNKNKTSGFFPFAGYTPCKLTSSKIKSVICYLRFVGMVSLLAFADLVYSQQEKVVTEHNIDIAQLPLPVALNQLARQTDTLVLFPYDLVENRKSSPVRGRYQVLQALNVMLKNSDLVGGLSKKGVLTVSRKTANNNEPKQVEKPMKTKKTLLAQALSFLAATFPVYAIADTSGTDGEIEEVVVTGSAVLIGFGESNANNTIDLEMIESSNPTSDVLNLINRLPGINVTQGDSIGGNDYSTRIYIRGMSNSRSTAQIGYMIDNMPNGDAFYGGGQKPNRFIDSENVAQVNVGQNASDISSASNTALGGTIRYYSDEPMQEFGVRAAITTGTDSLSRQFIRLDTGEFADGWSSYLSYSNSSINSWVRAGSGEFDREHVDFKLLGDFASGLTIDFRASYNFRDEDDYDAVTLTEFAEDPRWDGLYDEFDFDTVADLRRGWGGTRWDNSYSLEISQKFDNGVTFTATPYYHRQYGFGWWTPPYRVASVDGNVESASAGPREYFQGTFARTEQGGLIAAQGTDISGYSCLAQWHSGGTVDYALDPNFSCDDAQRIATRRQSLYNSDRMGITAEAEIPFGNHLVTIGGWVEYYDRDNGRHWFDLDVNDPGTIRPQNLHWTNYDRNFETSSSRFYIQDTLDLQDWTITAGLVSHKVSTDYVSRIDSVTRSQSNHELLPKFGAIYRFDQTSEVFASYSKNVRHLRDSTLTAGETTLLSPELSNNFDLGYRWFGENLGVVAQIFNQQFTDRLGERDAVSAGEDMFLQDQVDLINIGGVDNYGAELALTYDMSKALSFFTSYSFLNSEYSEDVPAEGIKKGNELINTASNQFFAEVVWRPAGLDEKLKVALNGKYVGDRKGNIANTDTLDSYNIFGFNASYDLGQIGALKEATLKLNAQNITDENYLAAPDGDSGGRYYIGAPRSVSFTIDAKF